MLHLFLGRCSKSDHKKVEFARGHQFERHEEQRKTERKKKIIKIKMNGRRPCNEKPPAPPAADWANALEIISNSIVNFK